MNIIVTGGSGFLGKHLCRALAKAGHHIKVIDLRQNPEFPTVIADVRDAARMQTEIRDVDVVFHLASLIEAGDSVKFPQKYVDFNISGTVSVLEAMRLNNITTFLFSSSAAIYGEPEKTPISENDRTLPINPYGMTKLAMEGLLRSYIESYGFTGVALRYFNLYGPGEDHQPETHAIPRFIKQIYQDQPVTVWGSGEHQRDYIYIDDIVDAHLKALDLVTAQPQKYHYFNLSTERPTAVIDLVQLIGQHMGKTPQIDHHDARPGDPLVLVANAAKAAQQLNWRAQVDLPTGLQKTITYFLESWAV